MHIPFSSAVACLVQLVECTPTGFQRGEGEGKGMRGARISMDINTNHIWLVKQVKPLSSAGSGASQPSYPSGSHIVVQVFTLPVVNN